MKSKLEEAFIKKDYAVETLINGNISECIDYLRKLFKCGTIGISVVHEELKSIQELVPDRYEYIKKKVFTL